MAEITKLPETADAEENELLLRFKKPFHWEDQDYTEVDLSGLENLNGRQLCEIHKKFDRLGIPSSFKENNPDFAVILAVEVTGMPEEFFFSLPAKTLNDLKNKVFSYFFTED